MPCNDRSEGNEAGKTAVDKACDCSPQRWALWRLDDNGNRFRMETFASRECAEAAARDYTARGHKQNYWVEAAAEEDAAAGEEPGGG